MLKIMSTPLKLPILCMLSVCCLMSACSNNGITLDKKLQVQKPFNRLAAMTWQLNSIKHGQRSAVSNIASGIPVNRYHLDFADGHMRLRGGCNSMNGVVKIPDLGKMQVGPMVMTNRGCNTKLMQADMEIGRTLSSVTHYQVDKRRLAMLGAKQILLFDGVSKAAGNITGPAGLRKARFW